MGPGSPPKTGSGSLSASPGSTRPAIASVGAPGLGCPSFGRVADDHGASVAVADAPGGGAVITVLFPLLMTVRSPNWSSWLQAGDW